MDLATVGIVAGVIVTVVAAAGALVKVTRSTLRGARRVGDFLDDWRGEPERWGRPASPGVLARLSSVETSVNTNSTTLRAMNERLSAVETELKPNGGSSFRDRVERAIDDEGG